VEHKGWQFWVDRGGTFTDVVALSPDGRLMTHKLLSHAPGTPPGLGRERRPHP